MCLMIAKPVNLSETERGLLTTLPEAEQTAWDFRDGGLPPCQLDHDVKAWKVLVAIPGGLISPWFMFQYECGRTYWHGWPLAPEEGSYQDHRRRVYQGFHVWRDRETAEVESRSEKSSVIVECTVPAGAHFYVGTSGDAVCDVLRINKVVYSKEKAS